MTRNMPIQWMFFIIKFWELESYILWFLYPCIFNPNTTASAPLSPTALVPPWDVFPSPHSLIHYSCYPQVLVCCTNSSSHLHFQQKFSYLFSLHGYLFSLDGDALLCLWFTWLKVPCRNSIAGMKDEKLCIDLTLYFPLGPEPQCLDNSCCIDFKEGKLLSDSYTTSFISIQSRAGI